MFKVVKFTADFRQGDVTQPIQENVAVKLSAAGAHDLQEKYRYQQQRRHPIEGLFVEYLVKLET